MHMYQNLKSALAILLVSSAALLKAGSADPVGPPPVTTIQELVQLDSGESPGFIILGFKRNLIVSFPELNQVREYSREGELLAIHTLPVATGNLTHGVLIKWNGEIFVVVNGFFSNDAEAQGVWKINSKGIEKFADLPLGSFLTDIAIDKSDHLYIADSLLGKIWKVGKKGHVHTWIESPLLQGDPEGLFLPGIPLGAEALAVGKKHKYIYVSNKDRGTIVKIKVERNGDAGKAKIFVQDERLKGIDGISFNRRGCLYAIIPSTNTILSIAKNGTIEQVYANTPLDAPSGITMKKEKGANIGYFTNRGLFELTGPGIFRIRVACDPFQAD